MGKKALDSQKNTKKMGLKYEGHNHKAMKGPTGSITKRRYLAKKQPSLMRKTWFVRLSFEHSWMRPRSNSYIRVVWTSG